MAISNRQMRFILIWLAASNAVAQEGAGLQEPIPRTSDLFVADEVVSIASGHSQGEQTAPAVTSVITAQQIKDTGARNIYDVLRTVPWVFPRSTCHWYPTGHLRAWVYQ
jgi:outer membrane receptor for ferrienterochelin and colicin